MYFTRLKLQPRESRVTDEIRPQERQGAAEGTSEDVGSKRVNVPNGGGTLQKGGPPRYSAEDD